MGELRTPEAVETEVRSIYWMAKVLTLTDDQRVQTERRIDSLFARLLTMYGGDEIAGFPRYPGGRKFQVVAPEGTGESEAVAIAMAATATGVLSVFARLPQGGYQFVICDSVCANHYEFRRYLIETGYTGMATSLHIS